VESNEEEKTTKKKPFGKRIFKVDEILMQFYVKFSVWLRALWPGKLRELGFVLVK